MAAELEYQAKIQSYNWKQLQDLWRAIEKKDTPEWAAGKALEYLIIRAFELENAKVRYPYSVPMDDSHKTLEQIDGVIYSQGLSCLVECKDTEKPIDFGAISKLKSQLMRRPSTIIGNIFSCGGFTEAALLLLRFNHPYTILAWQEYEIDFCLNNQFFCKALIKKHQKAVELGVYNFNILTETRLWKPQDIL